MAENWVHSRSCVLSRESVTGFILDPVFYLGKVQVGINLLIYVNLQLEKVSKSISR